MPDEFQPEIEEAVEEQLANALTDDELRNICEQQFQAGKPPSEVVADQYLALRQFFLEPDGNEEEGYSKVQSSDVRDAVESALPILLDMFMSSESPVVFRPSNSDDIEQADQETAFCQYVLHTQNPGLLLIYRWWKDAMLFKNGYIKVFWDALVEQEKEDYEGITQDEYTALLNDDSFEAVAAAQRVVMTTDPEGQPVPMPVFDVTGKRKREAGQVRIINIPADRVRVAPSWVDIELSKAPYVCHGPELRTRSDLKIDGYDPAIVDGLPTSQDVSLDEASLSLDRGRETATVQQGGDKSRELVEVYEHYIRADRDGDGIAELLQVVTAGRTGGKVLAISEVDDIPVIATTGYVIPHSHYGMSLAELVGETQKIKTAILRQTLDNLYLTNRSGLEVDQTVVTNPEVLSQPRAGMVLFRRGPGPATSPLTVPFTAAQSLSVMQAVNDMSEQKTGLSPETTGLDATSLAQSTNMVGAMTLNQAQLRMKLLASMLVETGFKQLMLRVRELVMKHMTREEMVLLGSKWLSVNPRNWREKRNTQLRIGVGTVQKQERVAVLKQIADLQQSIVSQQQGINGPFVMPQNIYNTLNDMERLAGHLSTDRYFSNPENWQAPPPTPDIPDRAMQLEEAKLVVKAHKDAADVEARARELSIKEAELGFKVHEQANRQAQDHSDRLREAWSASTSLRAA